jgi:TRAP-type mannitol/chloroaromatic compound transport system permease small subunit
MVEGLQSDAGGGRPATPPDAYNRPLPFGLHRLTGTMNAIGTLWIFVIMLLMTADVAGRNLFNTPIRGVLEIVTLSIVSIVFLQLADTLRTGRFTRADALLGALQRSQPRVARALQAIFHLLGAALLSVMCVTSWPYLVDSWQSGEYLGAIGDFRAYLWPMRAVIVAGSGVTALTFFFLALADLRAALARRVPV